MSQGTDYLIETMNMAFNAGRNKQCSISECHNTPTNLYNDLCNFHEDEMLAASLQWEKDKLFRRSYAGPCLHDGQPHDTSICPCKATV